MSATHILALASDLFFAPHIEHSAASLGLSTQWIDQYRSSEEFMRTIQEDAPALIVLDLNSSLPWIEWLASAKGSTATRRIPWLAYGSHMNPRRLKAARHAGADKVVPRSEFSANLPQLMAALIRNQKETP